MIESRGNDFHDKELDPKYREMIKKHEAEKAGTGQNSPKSVEPTTPRPRYTPLGLDPIAGRLIMEGMNTTASRTPTTAPKLSPNTIEDVLRLIAHSTGASPNSGPAKSSTPLPAPKKG